MTRVLAYRFSAFGDVAMSVPVFIEILEQNPGLEIVMVSRENFAPLFTGVDRLKFHGVNIDAYKGYWGLRKLCKQLIAQHQPNIIANLHDVIRTKILDRAFRQRGYPVFKINKGKEEKENLTDIWNLNKFQLKRTVERYADVFRDMGFSVALSHQLRSKNSRRSGIGFAPFAQHISKMMPEEKSFELAKILAKKNKIFFFGGGTQEIAVLAEWEKKIPNAESLAGKFDMRAELQKIAELELMISMDSANMHLASLMGTRCISLWCATHHYAGFLGYGQREEDIVHVKDLSCRPCSVFGDKECYRGDYACRHEMEVAAVISKVDAALKEIHQL